MIKGEIEHRGTAVEGNKRHTGGGVTREDWRGDAAGGDRFGPGRGARTCLLIILGSTSGLILARISTGGFTDNRLSRWPNVNRSNTKLDHDG